MRPIWAICTKSGKSALELGRKNTIIRETRIEKECAYAVSQYGGQHLIRFMRYSIFFSWFPDGNEATNHSQDNRQIRKACRPETQSHGYFLETVSCPRRNPLILAMTQLRRNLKISFISATTSKEKKGVPQTRYASGWPSCQNFGYAGSEQHY